MELFKGGVNLQVVFELHLVVTLDLGALVSGSDDLP